MVDPRPTVLEVGPGVVRPAGAGAGAVSAVERAALAGVDDPVVLLDERPVAAADLWRRLLGSALSDAAAGPLVAVCPTWWPTERVERILAVAPAGSRRIDATTRAELIRRGLPASTVVVEIAADLVAVSAGDDVRLVDRHDAGRVVAAVADLGGGTAGVLVDAARGVPGAEVSAAGLCAALEQAGMPADRAILSGTPPADPPRRGSPPRRGRLLAGVSGAVAVGAVAVGAVALAALAAPGIRPQVPAPQSPGEPLRSADPVPWSSLVEGRVAVRIPPDWALERVTAGPGSRRVQLTSPDDPGAVVHITQSYAPGTTLADTADVLGRRIAAEASGVFTDFRPEDRVAGRPAVTYRENRPGRTVTWTVLLDGSTRISVGCQAGSGSGEPARTACLAAVGSARELAGR